MSSDASARKGTSVSEAPSSLASSAYSAKLGLTVTTRPTSAHSWISKAINTLLPVVTTVPEAGQASCAAMASLKASALRSV
ncbi:hypothetical protein FQZ97_1218810 [compost metagenome]